MAITRSIGRFDLIERVGAGGMGEVFRARDQRLNRLVAVKILPVAANPTARERFQRESLAIAALNHPNICTLYEAGEDGGQPYLVMELLEGETLHARLARGPAGVAQIAQWGSEIADALHAAHAKGILHRDLKPGNIFITHRSAVKVLDFGLAQFTATPASDSDAATVSAAVSPPISPLTSPGTALGTYAYMAPEQARGEPSDARSDIFSLGVVLYEMAGGRLPFRGRTSADLMAAILMLTPPAPSTLRPEIPPRLDDVIAQCLEKDPDLRFQTATDLRVSLRRLQGASSSSGPPSSHSTVAEVAPAGPAPTPPPTAAPSVAPPRAWRLPAAAALVVAVAGAAWWALRARGPSGPPQLQFQQLTFSGQVQDAAISPDGRFLAHVDAGPQGTSLHLMAVGNGSDTEIVPPGPGCCSAPTFSRDGDTVYFVANQQLLAVPVLGGTARVIAQHVCSGAGASPDGKQIAFLAPTYPSDALTLAAPDGSGAHVLSDPRPGGYDSQCWVEGPGGPDAPAWSPDGKWIAVQQGGNGKNFFNGVVLVDAASGRTRELGPKQNIAASNLAWLPNGSGIVMAASVPALSAPQVWLLRFPQGTMAQLTHDLQGYRRVSVAGSAGGALAMIHSAPQHSVWMQARAGGAFEQLPGGGADQDGARGLAWTPQSRLVSVRALGGKSQVWLEGGPSPATQLPLAQLPPLVFGLQVAPSGQIVFDSLDPMNRNSGLLRVNPDGSGLTSLTPGLESQTPAFLQHGAVVAFEHEYVTGDTSHQRLWVVPLAGGTPRQLWDGEVYINFVLAMPDQQHVLVVAQKPDSVVEISLNGAPPIVTHPREYHGRFGGPYGLTPDGRALTSVIHSGVAENIWAAPLDGSPLYQLTHFTDLHIANYAFAPDGRLAVSRGSQNSDAVLATGMGSAH